MLLVGMVLFGSALLFFISCQKNDTKFVETHQPQRAAALSPQGCAECHAEIVAEWENSHHALANRLVDFPRDSAAFQQRQNLSLGERNVSTSIRGQSLVFKENGKNSIEVAAPVGVIGYDPLIQYLIPTGNGKLQTYTLSYEPTTKEWFYVFEDDVRLPGEWGHWSGQGMNWNANCGYCHMTDYHKNLDQDPSRPIAYESQWLYQGISCAQCHNGLEEHVKSPDAPEVVSLNAQSKVQIEHSCATCHARRQELTVEAFRPGDSFHDHYGLSAVDQGDLYHPDGQVNNENFVYTSMQLNKMGHAGISCMDCHNPHTAALSLPADNNALCMKCHTTGDNGATLIDPIKHSRHQPGSEGARCIECHMPDNTFMARDDRRDHIFSIPDPQLSAEIGSPDTCTACHTDQNMKWAGEWVETWWPDHATKRVHVRERARAIQSFRDGSASDYKELLRLAQKEEILLWKASLTGMLTPWSQWKEVETYLRQMLAHTDPHIRSAAVRALARHPQRQALLAPLLQDEFRVVRIQAAQLIGPAPEYREEYETFHRFSSDRPNNALMLADYFSADPEQQKQWIRRSISLEPTNDVIYGDGAVLLARGADVDGAKALLLEGIAMAPQSASLRYSLALIEAEQQNYSAAINWMQQSVRLDPQQPRAWYNLSILLRRQGDLKGARAAAEKAYELSPNDPGIMQLMQMP